MIINVIRVDKDNSENGESAKVQVLKNRDFPELPIVPCHFNTDTNFYQELEENGTVKSKIFKGWRKFLKDEKGNAVKFKEEPMFKEVELEDCPF